MSRTGRSPRWTSPSPLAEARDRFPTSTVSRPWCCRRVALVGYRDFDDNDRFGSEHVRDSGITVLDYRDLRAGTIPLILERALAAVTKPEVRGFWVHLDVDVLDDAIMPAVDYRQEGGLSWDEAAHCCRGCSVGPAPAAWK